MDLRTQRNSLKLIWQLMDQKNVTLPIIPFRPQKPEFREELPFSQSFPRCPPEAEGIASDRIYDFINELKNDSSLDMHCLMILRNGSVISECSFGAYRTDIWHVTHSLCKSITGLAVGMLIDEGSLSIYDRIVKIFEKKGSPLSPITKKSITVQNLLTMTSGVSFNESGAVTEEDWIDCFLDSSTKFEAGKEFHYNSMNTYMLSAIVRQISGECLSEFLKKRLFDPLGIRNVYWESCPAGIEKGGWGLYILPEDMAKIGQLFLQNGVWNGKRIVSEDWIKSSTSFKTRVSESLGDFDYGYQIWVGRRQRSFLFNGMFGQNVIGFPDTGILIVTTAGNNELFQRSGFFTAVRKYFGADFNPPASLPKNSAAHRRLLRLQQSLRQPAHPNSGGIGKLFAPSGALPKQCAQLSGKTYVIDEDSSKCAGLMPLIAQVLQNNYSDGIRSVSFSAENRQFRITVREGDKTFVLPVGFTEARYTTLNMHGESYLAGITGSFSNDEDGNMVLKLRISFIEIANSRIMKFYFRGNRVVIKCIEQPGMTGLKMLLSFVEKELSSRRIYETLISKLDGDFLDYKLMRAFEPELHGRLEE